MLQGNFNGCGTLNPGIGTNNQVPLSMLSPTALAIAAKLPALSNASGGTYNLSAAMSRQTMASEALASLENHNSGRGEFERRRFVPSRA
jgi:hypothetical protein